MPPFALTRGHIDPRISLFSHRHPTPAGFWRKIAVGPMRRIEPSEAGFDLQLSTHQSGDLVIITTHFGSSFTPAGWTNRTSILSAGRMGFYFRVSDGTAFTFAVPANSNAERGYFMQCATFRPENLGTPTQVRLDSYDLPENPDAGGHAQAGSGADAALNTLVIVNSVKIYDNFNAGSPTQVTGFQYGMTMLGHDAEDDWNAASLHRANDMAWAWKNEPASALMADTNVDYVPAGPWSAGSTASSSRFIRFEAI